MSQEELLQIINENPGIEQSKLNIILGRKNIGGGGTGHQILQLLKRKEIKRISVHDKHGTTYQLFPAERI